MLSKSKISSKQEGLSGLHNLETDLQKVLKQKIPYHAHVYPEYKLAIRNHYDCRPLAKIKRAHIIAGTEEHKDCDELVVFCHTLLCNFTKTMEERNRINGWGIKNLKIFHIWNIKVNGKLGFFPWSAKFQPSIKEIEVEILTEEEKENEISKVIINTEDCDRSLIVTVNDCEVNYSVFSDAWRLELEIRLYEDDGSPALNFSGSIHAYLFLGKPPGDCYITIFDGEYKNEESEAVFRSTLILPRHIWYFSIDMALVGNDGKFESMLSRRMIPCSVPIDEQHYILCQHGHMLVTAKWGCCCVDKGLCTCPGTTVCGIETFQSLSEF